MRVTELETPKIQTSRMSVPVEADLIFQSLAARWKSTGRMVPGEKDPEWDQLVRPPEPLREEHLKGFNQNGPMRSEMSIDGMNATAEVLTVPECNAQSSQAYGTGDLKECLVEGGPYRVAEPQAA